MQQCTRTEVDLAPLQYHNRNENDRYSMVDTGEVMIIAPRLHMVYQAFLVYRET